MKPDILNHEKILSIFKELEQNPTLTQRALAQKLKISLGKVNYFINALIDKGIIEAKNFKNAKNKLGYMYLLTPDGIRIKFQLIQQFLDWKTREYERLKEELEAYKGMLLAYQNAELLPELNNNIVRQWKRFYALAYYYLCFVFCSLLFFPLHSPVNTGIMSILG